ncbi:unnamed protein product [Rotaria magnacalcarata]|uniref:NAD(P)(+)--arginine ADP-ribosyltransferase n=1 Tax=Rotaria magnacalcarata TaxID=392030 RepID=A0A814ITR2_9BILA|nr:unnamed protein product [Rotaria magnacalcarata]CAF1653438.1 unnamed protein product [Rotaria magnacalcarata]CAF3960626.1 unnamed protein product [Rotaria magnacalcarata]
MAEKNARVARFLDAAQEPKKELTPIEGYEKTDLMTLEQSMQSMTKKLHNLDTMIKIALRNSRKPVNGLTSDESAAIHLYTMQWPETHASVYTSLNEALRCQNRRNLTPWFPYLKLFFTALYKLPSLKGTIWRGVRGNLNDAIDEDLIWWGVSSCTEKVKIMEDFLGTDGERTLFNIECTNGKSIRAQSHFEAEEEVLLLPGTYLKVVSRWSPSKDLHIIHLREEPAPYQTIAPPFEATSSPVDLPSLKPLTISKEPPKVSTAAAASVKPSMPKPAAPASSKPKFRNPRLEKIIAEQENKEELNITSMQLTEADMEIVVYYVIGQIKVMPLIEIYSSSSIVVSR